MAIEAKAQRELAHYEPSLSAAQKQALALEEASTPTLLMCLAQVTGDARWIQSPYLPKRDVELFADETGGLAAEIQDEVREAVANMLDDIAAGRLEIPPAPSEKSLLELMSVAVGEPVGPEYVPMFSEEMGLKERDVKWNQPQIPESAKAFTVVIIGSGVSGICAAIKLSQLGVSVTVLEKNSEIGGTWFENDYPECGVDTPNHFYSYSFAPNPGWSRFFSKRDEILEYLQLVARRYEIVELVRTDTTVESLTWDDATKKWRIAACGPAGAEVFEACAVISAVGQLNQPKLDAVPGIEKFEGPVFHSARWDHDLDLSGKRVAMVGTGASAMQILPTLAAKAGEVDIFQRSPQWVKESKDYHRYVSDGTQWLMENVPFYAMWYRFGLFWRFGDGLLRSLKRDSEWDHPERSMNKHNERHRQQMIDYLRSELEGREDIIEKVLPDYPPYGKRILVDNDWFVTLRRPNVSLVTEAVKEVRKSDVVTSSGEVHPADVLVLATGFDAARMLNNMDVRGLGQRSLRAQWGDDDPRAYLGITIPGFPNFFCMYGPNTNLAHGGSIIFQAECQVRYISDAIKTMVEEGWASIDVQRDAHDEYIQALDEAHSELVWSHPGVTSWYRNSSGRVFSPMPWRMVDYWSMTHDFDPSLYKHEPSNGNAAELETQDGMAS